jgi:hypothetical protein
VTRSALDEAQPRDSRLGGSVRWAAADWDRAGTDGVPPVVPAAVAPPGARAVVLAWGIAAEVGVRVGHCGHFATSSDQGTPHLGHNAITSAHDSHQQVWHDSEHYHAWADLHAPDHPMPLDPWAVP